MNLATTEVRRAKLRFGLLTGAVSLLIFLVLLLTTLANALVNSLVGALDGLAADGLVYSQSARDNIQASRLQPTVTDAVVSIPGVTAVGAVGTLTASAVLEGEQGDLQVFGFEPGRPGAPTALTDGRLPETLGEVAVDGGGLAIGDTVDVGTAKTPLTVVGLLRGAQFNALPTGYTTLATYQSIVTAEFPGLPFVPINAVAFDTASDAAPVASTITASIPDAVGYTRSDAVGLIPGIESISQSFGILQGLTFLIAVVVIGFFFLILTVQKLRAITVLRAIGASKGRLGGSLIAQIVIVVLAASVLAVLLTLGALQGLNSGIPVTVDAGVIGGVVVAVLAFALLSGIFSVRRLTRIDPATATGVR